MHQTAPNQKRPVRHTPRNPQRRPPQILTQPTLAPRTVVPQHRSYLRMIRMILPKRVPNIPLRTPRSIYPPTQRSINRTPDELRSTNPSRINPTQNTSTQLQQIPLRILTHHLRHRKTLRSNTSRVYTKKSEKARGGETSSIYARPIFPPGGASRRPPTPYADRVQIGARTAPRLDWDCGLDPQAGRKALPLWLLAFLCT